MRRSAILMVLLVGVCGCSDDNRGRGLRPLSFAVGVQWHPERLCDLKPSPVTCTSCKKPSPTNVGNGLPVFEWFASQL